MTVGPGEAWTEPVFVYLDVEQLHIGRLGARLLVTDDLGETVQKRFELVGPRRAVNPSDTSSETNPLTPELESDDG